MNKKELIEKIAEEVNVPKKTVAVVIDGFQDAVVDSMMKDESVKLVGFGTFGVTNRASRNGVNPRTGEKMVIPAIKSPTFKAGKSLKNKLNGRDK